MTSTKDQFQMNPFGNQFNRIRLLVCLWLRFSDSLSPFFLFSFQIYCVPSKAIRLHCLFDSIACFMIVEMKFSLLCACIFSIHCGTTIGYFKCGTICLRHKWATFFVAAVVVEIEPFICVWFVIMLANARTPDTNRYGTIENNLYIALEKDRE